MNQVAEHIRRANQAGIQTIETAASLALETMEKLAALNLGMVKDALEQRETNSRKLVTAHQAGNAGDLAGRNVPGRLAPGDGLFAAGHGNRKRHAQQLVQTGCRADTGLLTGSAQESRLTADAVTQRGEQRSASRRFAGQHRAMCQKCHELPIELLAQSASKDSRARSRGVDVSIAENRLKYQARGAEFIASRRTGGPSLLLVAAMIAATLAGGIKAGSRPNSGDESTPNAITADATSSIPATGADLNPAMSAALDSVAQRYRRGTRGAATDIRCRTTSRSRA
jgi:hypothetical protein